ncbi:hypothetical protein PO909_033813 [Leuciscus waleckii]
MEKKNLGRTQAQSVASSPLANERTVYDYDSGSITGQKSDWIRTFRIFIQFHLVERWSHHAGMETSLLRISADGCRVDEAFTGLMRLALQGCVEDGSRRRSTI